MKESRGEFYLKKWLKVIMGIIGVILLFIIIDMISIYTRNKPIFAIKGSTPNSYNGLLYDTYLCSEYSTPQVKAKGTKYTCATNTIEIKQYTYTIDTIETTNCNQEKTLYMSIENQNVYTYCLDNIKINDGFKTIELKDFYQENSKVLEEITNTLTLIETYKDGGSQLYRDNNDTDFTNQGLSIINCNTLEGNQDIYIGPTYMEYEKSFCKYDENMKEFIEE